MFDVHCFVLCKNIFSNQNHNDLVRFFLYKEPLLLHLFLIMIYMYIIEATSLVN